MNQDATTLRWKASEAKRAAEDLAAQIATMEHKCFHSWGEIRYDPIVESSYTISGDPPGTMGIDWRGPVYVPGKTTKRWTRTCKLCGKSEETKATREEVTQVPRFG